MRDESLIKTFLGYSVSCIKGDLNSKFCDGCYWYDIKEFNKTISKDYKDN